ncbi:hypothetical protein [Nocardia transvalensis]|uniref:hypothetical protein n=1 Tax=Nocardia transvalensis TaxID=37333 RepID=UPI00189505E4|nr:hypothetical protein [Nocardia transvalensis]MBF6327821.1 hypothetical protein [Nocardia transvalensis]
MSDQVRPGSTLVTTDHGEIRSWAEHRGARPAVVDSPEQDAQIDVLRFDFPGFREDGLREVSWAEWFRIFEERELRFRCEQSTPDGGISSFFRLESRESEDG